MSSGSYRCASGGYAIVRALIFIPDVLLARHDQT